MTYDSFTVRLSAENVDVSTLSAAVDDRAATLTAPSTDSIVITADGLEPATAYTYRILGENSDVLYTGSITTARRTPASVTLSSEEIGFDHAELTFAVTNPDSNPLRINYDGTALETAFTGNTYVHDFTGLVSGETHTLEFVDWDGTVLLTHSFAARRRVGATVSFTDVTAGFDSISVTLSVNNPDGNELRLKLGDDPVDIDFTAAAPSTTVTGLTPRTDYTLTVTDVSLDQVAASAGTATQTSVTATQDASGNVHFEWNSDFLSDHSFVEIRATDSLGYTIPVTVLEDDVMMISASTLMYADEYTITVTAEDVTADSFTVSLTGDERPAFELNYHSNLPATLEEALNDTDWHTSYSKYPEFNYELKSGVVREPMNDDGEFQEGPLLWTALILKNSSGEPMTLAVSGLTGLESDRPGGLSGKAMLYFQYKDGSEELPEGNYNAALYVVAGYTLDEMVDLVNAYNEYNDHYDDIFRTFMEDGRQATADVPLVKAESGPTGYAYANFSNDPVVSGTQTSWSINCSYYFEGADEGFLVIVSADDPTVQLCAPISLGTGDGSIDPGTIVTDTTSPVFIIIYINTFSPDNYLFVQYYEP